MEIVNNSTQCPLCKEYFPPARLRDHMDRESEEIRHFTIEFIKSQHPEWIEQNGACTKCWEYYKKL